MSKRLTSLLLALLMLSQLCACSQSTENSDTAEDTAAVSAEDTETVEEEVDELEALWADLPKADYEGYDFGYLNNISNFAYTSMYAEEITGDGINDAFFNRNLKVSEDLNCQITEYLVDYSVVTSNMTTAITAGDTTYSAFWNESTMVAPFALKGQLIDVNTIDSLALDKPWWNTSVIEEASFGGKAYFLIGDIHLMFKESYWMVGFNRSILEDYGLDDLYDKVREGTWTYDAMKEDMVAVTTDRDGDGTMTADKDLWGGTCYGGYFAPMIIGSGEVFFTRDEEGRPAYPEFGDRFYSVYEKVVSNFSASDATGVYLLNSDKVNTAMYTNGFHDVFLNGNALFYFEPIGSLKKLRDMDYEFGILPYPKYDESQEEYHTLIAGYGAFCGIPITCSDVERAGTILENLCGRSYGELNDAYVNTTLNFKYIRDKDSKEMLDIIFDTGRINLGAVIGLSAKTDAITSAGIAGNLELASALAKTEKVANKQLEKIIENLGLAE